MGCTLLPNTGLYFDENGNPCSTADNTGGSSSGWLSGAAQLFSSIGQAVSSGIAAASAPQPVAPFRTSTGTNTSASPGVSMNTVMLVALAAVAFIALRRR